MPRSSGQSSLPFCSQGPQEFSCVLVLSVVKCDNLAELGASVVAELDVVPQPPWLPACKQASKIPFKIANTWLLNASSL